MEIEKGGTPTVTLCTTSFDALGQSLAAALGEPSLPIVSLPRKVQIERQSQASLDEIARGIIDEIVYILTQPRERIAREYRGKHRVEAIPEANEGTFSSRLAAADLESVCAPATAAETSILFYERGWTDGLPIVPPTRTAVEKMLEYSDRDADEVVGVLAPRQGHATVIKIAVNAVMAGCLPQYLPVVVAAVEALADPAFGLGPLQATTSPVAPLAVINGPIVKELGFNFGYNAFGPGTLANATVGRAIRLIMLNIGGGEPGTIDKAVQGGPAKYSWCVAENEQESPWPPLSVERGFGRYVSTVTLFAGSSYQNFLGRGDARELLLMAAETMAVSGSNCQHIGAEALLALNPGHADCFARAGYGKDDIKRFIFENARTPFSKRTRDWQEGWKNKHNRPNLILEGEDPMVPVTDRWEDIQVLVVGAWGSHGMFIPGFLPTSRTTTKVIRLQGVGRKA
ncbi:MAG: hypothetical protein HYX92_06700 [Chloroflexi bacterium]|nr:hypothetical protein [Chloroflexota bacterium]